MTEILQLLLKHFMFLLESGRYRFVDSGVAASFGGDAFVVLESERVKLRFIRDRGQLFLDFQEPPDGAWYSVDVVQELLTKEIQDSAELDAARLAFVTSNIDVIEARFAESSEHTRQELRKLEHVRAKRLFG